MTFIVGLQCIDGVVLCTDSLEDDGITKKTVNKIRPMGTSQWQVAMSVSGSSGICDKFPDEVSSQLVRGPFDRTLIENTIENVLSDFHSKYQEHFEVIVAVYDSSQREHLLYRGLKGVLSREIGECHTGMGNELWRMLADTIYSRSNSVEDNIRLAVFATRLAIKYASGVDGPVQAISYTFAQSQIGWKWYTPTDILAIESEINFEGFKEALQGYWRKNNPPTRVEQLRKFRIVQTGDELTLLEGVKLEELYTVQGRKRASKIFRRNTDKLQQRGHAERQRRPAAASGVSRSSGGKNRT